MIRPDAISSPPSSAHCESRRQSPRAVRRPIVVLAASAIAVFSACNVREAALNELTYHSLPQSTGRLSDGFTIPFAVVERGDGLVLATDVAHQEIWLADFARGSRELFGRRGDGPGEYRAVHHLLPLVSDSVAVVSSAIPYRVSVVSGDGQPVRTRILSQFASLAQSAFDFEEFPQVSRADSLGRLYGARLAFSGSRAGITYLDSVPIMRLSMGQQEIDTVAFFDVGEQAASRRPHGKDESYSIGKGIFAAVNDWTTLRDGTIVAVDARTYTLTFLNLSRPLKAIPVRHRHPKFPVDKRQWNRYVDSLARATRTRWQREGSAMSVRMGTQFNQRDLKDNIRTPDMPDSWPPVLTSVTRMKLANGFLWIPVAGPDSPNRQYWDVVRTSVRNVETEYEKGALTQISAPFFYIATSVRKSHWCR